MPSLARPSSLSNQQLTVPPIQIRLAISGPLEELLQETGGRIPRPIAVRAAVEPGIPLTIVQEGLPAMLGIYPVRTQLICTPSSEDAACCVYPMRLILSGVHEVVHEVSVIEAPLKTDGTDCVLGGDVLSLGVFIRLDNSGLVSFVV
jgi:hypothetical protein